MKKLLSTPLIILMIILGLSTSSMMATSPTSTIAVVMHVFPTVSDPEPDLDPYNKRIPPRPLNCTISQSDGIEVIGCAAEFISYEIWDTEGTVCMAAYTLESDFINALFSMTGEYQIRLVCEDHELIGYIAL